MSQCYWYKLKFSPTQKRELNISIYCWNNVNQLILSELIWNCYLTFSSLKKFRVSYGKRMKSRARFAAYLNPPQMVKSLDINGRMGSLGRPPNHHHQQVVRCLHIWGFLLLIRTWFYNLSTCHCLIIIPTTFYLCFNYVYVVDLIYIF